MTYFPSALFEMRWGVLFALLTLGFGFAMGIAFGGFESQLKDYLRSEASSVLQSQYQGNESRMKKVTDKSWVYFKRAHLHANGLGTTAVALILLMSLIGVTGRLRACTALALGLGAFGYSIFWLLAGLSAPRMGSTAAAKEALSWLAIPTAALCTVGLLVVGFLVVTELFWSKRGEHEEV